MTTYIIIAVLLVLLVVSWMYYSKKAKNTQQTDSITQDKIIKPNIT